MTSFFHLIDPWCWPDSGDDETNGSWSFPSVLRAEHYPQVDGVDFMVDVDNREVRSSPHHMGDLISEGFVTSPHCNIAGVSAFQSGAGYLGMSSIAFGNGRSGKMVGDRQQTVESQTM